MKKRELSKNTLIITLGLITTLIVSNLGYTFITDKIKPDSNNFNDNLTGNFNISTNNSEDNYTGEGGGKSVVSSNSGSSSNGGGNPSCTPNCNNKYCGTDGCGGTCGTCEVNQNCISRICTNNYLIGFLFAPDAKLYSNDNHTLFIQGYKKLIDELETRGINAIIFHLNYFGYKWENDDILKNFNTPLNRRFTKQEFREMVNYSRSKGMKIILEMDGLTNIDLLQAYPQYGDSEELWESGKNYSVGNIVTNGIKVASDESLYPANYYCNVPHTSNSNNEPNTSINWDIYWSPYGRSRTMCALNNNAYNKMFELYDELIDSFSVNISGEIIKPEGVHLDLDEIRIFGTSTECGGDMDKSVLFNHSIRKYYNYFKTNHSKMEIIMWGDMLIPTWNGGTIDTYRAIDMIPQDIIIAHWDYGYKFPEYIQYFLDKGFRVWPTAWNCADCTKRNLADSFEATPQNKMIGSIYSTWYFSVIPNLFLAMTNQTFPSEDIYSNDTADTIIETSWMLGDICSGLDTYCGTYPNCENCNILDGYYTEEYRNYYCDNNACNYNAVNIPDDYTGYWKFEEIKNSIFPDESGIYNATIYNEADITLDPQKGNVLNLDGIDDYLDLGVINFDYPITYMAWLNPKGFNEHESFALGRYYRGYGLGLRGETQRQHWFSIWLENTNLVNTLKYLGLAKLFTWSHLAITYDGEYINYYLNGYKIDSVSANNENLYKTDDNWIVGNNGNGASFFNGTIDDVMIYNRSLSSEEIAIIYQIQSNPEQILLSNIEETEYTFFQKIINWFKNLFN